MFLSSLILLLYLAKKIEKKILLNRVENLGFIELRNLPPLGINLDLNLFLSRVMLLLFSLLLLPLQEFLAFFSSQDRKRDLLEPQSRTLGRYKIWWEPKGKSENPKSWLHNTYRISSYSCRGNYSFLELECGNYSREENIQGRKLLFYYFLEVETIQRRKLYEEIR